MLVVASTGNDPVSTGYQPVALPLSYEAIIDRIPLVVRLSMFDNFVLLQVS